MANSELLRLAEGGLAAFPPAHLGELATACRESGTARASARLLVLADAIGLLASAWEPHEAVPSVAIPALDRLVKERLPAVLAEPAEEAAVSLAASLREDVALILAGTW